jgi:hypothetical protein
MNPEYPYQPQQSPQTPQQPVPGQFAVPGSPQPVPQPGYAPIPPTNLPPIAPRSSGASKKWVIFTFVFAFTTLAAGAGAVWAYMNYQDQKNNVDTIKSVAVASAVKDQADHDATAFAEKEKQPNRQFVGPDDYGRLSFDYPKTWSAYVAKDATDGGTYEAYFNPGAVPAVTNTQRFALHVTIEEKDYDKVIDSYKSLVTSGDLKSSAIQADSQNGQRLDGNFSKDVRGSAVIFKIRDKTVTIRTDADTFRPDFDALIKTITFNK